jgi:hypothetical protein
MPTPVCRCSAPAHPVLPAGTGVGMTDDGQFEPLMALVVQEAEKDTAGSKISTTLHP